MTEPSAAQVEAFKAAFAAEDAKRGPQRQGNPDDRLRIALRAALALEPALRRTRRMVVDALDRILDEHGGHDGPSAETLAEAVMDVASEDPRIAQLQDVLTESRRDPDMDVRGLRDAITDVLVGAGDR